MKIRLIEKATPVTGKGRFALRLIKAMRYIGAEIVSDMSPCDIDLQFGKWRYHPEKCKKSVIRLGPAHVDSSQNYKKLNDVKWQSVKKCDAVIYQSEYSKKVCEKFIGKNRENRIIFNGADPEFYDGLQPYSSHYSINILASTRKWLPQKRLKYIIKAFISANIQDSCLIVNGETDLIKRYENYPNIMFFGTVNDKIIGRLLKLCNFFINITYLDAAPNAVVESLCAGCPVVCSNQGGTSELVGDNGLVLDIDRTYGFHPVNLQKPPKIDIVSLSDAMKFAVNIGRVTVPYLHINYIAKQYMEYFKCLMK